MKTREQAYNDLRQPYFLLECPYCKKELVIAHSELEKVLFEPHEEEYVYWQGSIDDAHKHIGKQMVSSDPSKDKYQGIKCCNCGHVWDEYVDKVHKNICNPDGRQIRVFELNEVETERAKAFREKHNHREEFKAAGKMGFTTLGHQFTYTITPGGLGPLVSIKCNHCGETEEITDTDSW